MNNFLKKDFRGLCRNRSWGVVHTLARTVLTVANLHSWSMMYVGLSDNFGDKTAGGASRVEVARGVRHKCWDIVSIDSDPGMQ
jgi:hypothetical protein